MIARNALTSLALALSLAVAPAMIAHAADDAKATQSVDVKAELANLKRMVGRGEISSKEYNARKKALMAAEKAAKK